MNIKTLCILLIVFLPITDSFANPDEDIRTIEQNIYDDLQRLGLDPELEENTDFCVELDTRIAHFQRYLFERILEDGIADDFSKLEHLLNRSARSGFVYTHLRVESQVEELLSKLLQHAGTPMARDIGRLLSIHLAVLAAKAKVLPATYVVVSEILEEHLDLTALDLEEPLRLAREILQRGDEEHPEFYKSFASVLFRLRVDHLEEQHISPLVGYAHLTNDALLEVIVAENSNPAVRKEAFRLLQQSGGRDFYLLSLFRILQMSNAKPWPYPGIDPEAWHSYTEVVVARMMRDGPAGDGCEQSFL